MTKAFRVPFLIAAVVVGCAASASAQAAPLTIGSPLVGVATPTTVNANVTVADVTLEGAGANATSPVSGAILHWHLLGAEGGPFSLRVLRPAGGSAYTGAGTSSPVVAAGPALQTFATVLPIQAGETIGLDAPKESKVGFIPAPLSSIADWVPALPEGATQPYFAAAPGAEVAFNAEVQPQPTVAAVSPPSGPAAGGTVVAVTGTDFAEVSAVKFGAVPATSYSVGSEGAISAVAPPGAAGATDITVTTVAGTSATAAGDKFTYTAPTPTPVPALTCTVPKLKGKRLKAAKKALGKADCKLGKLSKKKGATAKNGKVVKQSPEAGKVLTAGARVSIKLGAAR